MRRKRTTSARDTSFNTTAVVPAEACAKSPGRAEIFMRSGAYDRKTRARQESSSASSSSAARSPPSPCWPRSTASRTAAIASSAVSAATCKTASPAPRPAAAAGEGEIPPAAAAAAVGFIHSEITLMSAGLMPHLPAANAMASAVLAGSAAAGDCIGSEIESSLNKDDEGNVPRGTALSSADMFAYIHAACSGRVERSEVGSRPRRGGSDF
mmetsp:Transcript_48386/g.121970  ORF Transcript_48386/g.121970 Transcript_48386/m.121970 type:complete len:211 (-) Transcript_48386:14-646(-)